jgi:hypothetical protein
MFLLLLYLFFSSYFFSFYFFLMSYLFRFSLIPLLIYFFCIHVILFSTFSSSVFLLFLSYTMLILLFL